MILITGNPELDALLSNYQPSDKAYGRGFEEFHDLADDPGASSSEVETMAFIYGLILRLKPKAALETGTFQAKMSCVIAQAMQVNGAGHLWTIDSYGHPINPAPDVAQEHVRRCGLGDRVTLITGDGARRDPQVPDRLDFIFIDSDHRDPQPFLEILSWEPSLAIGGWMLFHDTGSLIHGCEGAPKAVTAFLATEADRYSHIHLDSGRGLDILVRKA